MHQFCALGFVQRDQFAMRYTFSCDHSLAKKEEKEAHTHTHINRVQFFLVSSTVFRSPPSPLVSHLLVITDPLHQLLHRHLLAILVEVSLRRQPGVVDQQVGVGRKPRHYTGGVIV